MRVNYALIALIVLSIATYGVNGASSEENDAGTGGDAGNLIQDALRLTSVGTVHGNLTSIDNVDWYAVDTVSTTVPTCVQGTWSSDYPMTFRLAGVNADRAIEIVSSVPTSRAGSAVPPGYTGHLVEMRHTTTLPPLLPYRFSTAHVEPPATGGYKNDAGSGRDSSAAQPLHFSSGCIGGAVQPNSYDATDVYTFMGSAGKTVALSLATATGAGMLSLADPAGATLASTSPGNVLSYTLPSTGTYTVTMSSSSGGQLPYVIGLCEPECRPPSNPCRPTCIDVLRD